MNRLLQASIVITLLSITSANNASAQNWQYVGAPYIHQNSSTSTFFYFGDMEMNAAGDILVGYWQNSGTLNLVKYSGGTWSPLPSPGTFPVSNLDVEVAGGNYYMAYSGVRGSNMYAWVQKYDGTSWQKLGDSVLLGNSGSGGWFDFVLDNNEVPTLLGVVSGPFADKQVMQYTGGSWSSVVTLAGTATTIFRDNSGIFDAQNKLLVVTQGVKMASQFYNLVNMIDGTTRTTVGDTLFTPSSASRIRLDATGNPFVIFNNALTSKVLAYKLNGATWSFIADTIGTTGTMINADITGTGKVVFNTLQAQVHKSVYLFENNTRSNMDSVNINGFAVGGMQDLVIPAGSNEVYALILEIKPTAAQDFSVVKHTVNGTNNVNDKELVSTSAIIYPNPSNGTFTVEQKIRKEGIELKVINIQGMLIYQAPLTEAKQTINLSAQPKGCYFIQLRQGANISTKSLLLQ
jgi:hypothetical protein